MMENRRTKTNNLPIFVGLPHTGDVFGSGLYQGCLVHRNCYRVQTFILDIVSNLDEDPPTTFLCVLAEQSIVNWTIDSLPPIFMNAPFSTSASEIVPLVVIHQP